MSGSRNKPNEIYLTRLYDADVKTVWDAWTDPKQVAKWWGPRGFTLTTHSKDLRPGGHWSYTMHGPDGKDWENKTIYHEVEKYSRLVYDHGGNDDRPPLFRVTVTFQDVKGKTLMEMAMAFENPEVAKQMAGFIKQAGGNSTWDRLAEFLTHEVSGKETFVINRTFRAPIETLYDLWTKPEHVTHWLAPTGVEMEFVRADIRPGGKSFFRMFDAGQTFEFFGLIEYVEMSRPLKLVYQQQFADASGKVSRHPHAPTWPETMLTTVAFASEGPNETRVTVNWEISGTATREELEAFIQERGGMTQGWTGSFDKLEEYLSRSAVRSLI